MKIYKSLLLLAVLFSCNNNSNTSNNKTIKNINKEDSSIKQNEIPPGINSNDTIFKGFMDLKWLSTKEEVKKYFKNKNSNLKIIEVGENLEFGDYFLLKGSFAGQKVKEVQINFYTNKMCLVKVDYGVQQDGFRKKLLIELEKKYGKGFRITNGYSWDFEYFKNNKMNEGGKLNLDYKSNTFLLYATPNLDKYVKLQDKLYNNKNAKKVNIKGKDL